MRMAKDTVLTFRHRVPDPKKEMAKSETKSTVVFKPCFGILLSNLRVAVMNHTFALWF